MKKHILGFALFSLIVGTSAFILSIFKVKPTSNVSIPDYSLSSQSKSCWKMKRKSSESKIYSPIINQAVINVKRKQINLELPSNSLINEEGKFPVMLRFFRKDANGTKYIASERIWFIPDSNYRGDQGVTSLITDSYDWLHNLDSYENLYINAEYVPVRGTYKENFQPRFDASQAVPVLLDYGR